MALTYIELKYAQLKQHMVIVHVGVVDMHGRSNSMIYSICGPIKLLETKTRHFFNILTALVSHYDA